MTEDDNDNDGGDDDDNTDAGDDDESDDHALTPYIRRP